MIKVHHTKECHRNFKVYKTLKTADYCVEDLMSHHLCLLGNLLSIKLYLML